MWHIEIIQLSFNKKTKKSDIKKKELNDEEKIFTKH